MLRTPILKRYEAKQVDINDQLCYYLFSDFEVEQHINNIASNEGNKFTTEVYAINKYAQRLNVRVGSLNEFRAKSFNTFCCITLMSSFEHLLGYMEEIQELRAKITPSVSDQVTDKKPEVQLENKLVSWVKSAEITGLIKTIQYLRLRRNHIAHVRDSLHDDLKHVIKNDSNYLNKYWGRKRTKIYNFDFSKERISNFDDQEIFAIVNLCLVCMRIIDELVLSSIDVPDIVKYEMTNFDELRIEPSLSLSKKVKKFNGYLLRKYGQISVSEKDYILYSTNA